MLPSAPNTLPAILPPRHRPAGAVVDPDAMSHWMRRSQESRHFNACQDDSRIAIGRVGSRSAPEFDVVVGVPEFAKIVRDAGGDTG